MIHRLTTSSLIAICCLLFALSTIACGPSSGTSSGDPYPSIEARAKAIKNYSNVTPKGVVIGLEDGVTVSAEEMNAIDNGIAHTFEKAKCKGYDGPDGLSHDQYVVDLVKSVPDSQGDPAYAQACAQYCGSEWDKGGYILVAGQVVGFQDASGNRNIIAIPDHSDRWDHEAIVAGFEVEHAVLKIYDPPEYERTKTHGTGTGHPIIPECPSLANRRALYGAQHSTPSYKGIVSR